MPPVYVTEQGTKLSVKGRRLAIAKDGVELIVVPLVKVSEVVLFGNVGLTTPAIKMLLRQGIDVVFLRRDGRASRVHLHRWHEHLYLRQPRPPLRRRGTAPFDAGRFCAVVPGRSRR